MAAEMRISMLVELNAQRGRAEAAALRAEIEKLGTSARSTGQTSGAAATGIAAIGTAGGKSAAEVTKAANANADYAANVAAIRLAINPLEAALQQSLAAIRDVAGAEELGALTSREAALAHDQLARSVEQITAKMAQYASTADATVAANARLESSVQQLIASNTGMVGSTGESIAAQLQHGMALDELRARFDPLFAASRRYELELRDIADAERQGALSAAGAAAARERMAQSLLAMPGRLNQVGASSRNASMGVAQLGYQFNDIAMMIAAGQNPLVLALQQGSQITQVLGPMGAAGAVKSLGTALLAMLSPVNLVTYAAIAGGAAFIQWAMSGKEGADEIRQGLRSVEEAIDQVKLKTLSIRFGEDNVSVAKVMDEMAIISAQLDVINQKYRESDSLSTRQRLAEEAMLLKNQYAEAANLVAKYRESVAEQDRLAASIAQTRQTFASLFGVVPQLTGAIKDASDEAHRLATSGPSGGWLAAAISDAETLGSKLWNAASAVLWLDQNKAGGTADLARQYKSYGEGRVAGEQANREAGDLYGGNYTDAQLGRTTVGSSGGGGGRAAETNGILALIAAEERELAILREIDPVKQEMLRNAEQMAKATPEQRVQLEGLIRAHQAEKTALESIKAAQGELGQTGRSLFVGLVSQTLSWHDALDQVLSKLLEMAANSVFDMLLTGSGGGGGILGNVIGSLFGVSGKADGGRIGGSGGPREDNHLIAVSTGEYIVNAAATRNALPLLEAINAGVPVGRLMDIVGGRSVAAYADGGLVGAAAPKGWGGARPSASTQGTSADGGDATGTIYIEQHIHIEGATGNSEIYDITSKAVKAGIEMHDREVLPMRVKEVLQNSRVAGR